MSEVYTFGVDLVYGGRKDAVWREDYDKMVAERDELAHEVKGWMDLAPITAGRLRELEAEVTELKDVASRKTAMIHRLAAELHKRNEAAKV